MDCNDCIYKYTKNGDCNGGTVDCQSFVPKPTATNYCAYCHLEIDPTDHFAPDIINAMGKLVIRFHQACAKAVVERFVGFFTYMKIHRGSD